MLVVDPPEPVIKHSNLRFLSIDVAAEAATRIAETAIAHWGRIDFLVNNAGMVGGGPVESMQLGDWDRILSVNVSAVSASAKRASLTSNRVPGTNRQHWINHDHPCRRRHGAYTTSKHAVAGLTKTLALELGEFGVTANYIQPGAIVTGITKASLDAGPEFEAFWSEKSALERLASLRTSQVRSTFW